MEKYEAKKVVGKGSYGSAIVARRKADGLVCVVKAIALARLSRGEARLVRQEAKLLATLRHPHIVSHLESFLRRNSSGGRELCIVMEYCECGDLEKWVAVRRRASSSKSSSAKPKSARPV